MKLSKQGWITAMMGLSVVKVMEGMQDEVSPLIGEYVTATPEEQQELLTAMLEGLSWLGSRIEEVSSKIENELESLE